MINRNRVVKRFTNSKFQDEYEKNIYQEIPKTENYVDDLEFVDFNADTLPFFKDCLKEAIKNIREFFVSTRLMSARNFCQNFKVLQNKGYIQETGKVLRFKAENFENSADRGNFNTEDMVVTSSKNMISKKDKIETTKILIHELIHFFMLGLEVRYNIESGKKVIFRKINDDNDKSFFQQGQSIDEFGDIHSTKLVELPIEKSMFFNEGYTELLTNLIYPKGKGTYLPQVQMVGFLEYITHEMLNFEGFAKLDLKKQFENFSEIEKSEIFLHADNFQRKYRHGGFFNFYEDRDYLKIQSVLLNSFLKKITNNYKRNNDYAEVISKLSKMIEYLPVHNKNVLNSIIKTILTNIPQKELKTNKPLTALMLKTFQLKFELCGQMKELDLNMKDKIAFSRNIDNEISLCLNSKIVSCEYIDHILNNCGTAITLFNDKTKIAADILSSFPSNGITIMLSDVKGRDFENNRALQLIFDRLDKNQLIYKEEGQGLKVMKLVPVEKEKEVQQALNFLSNIDDMIELSSFVNPKMIKSINTMTSLDTSSENKNVYIVTLNNGSIKFFKSVKNKLIEIEEIIRYNYSSNNEPIYETFEIIDEKTGAVEKGIRQKDSIPTKGQFTNFILENDAVISAMNNQGDEKYFAYFERKFIETKSQSIYSCENELINYAEIIENSMEEFMQND